jgi:hypothetical protein
MIIYDNWKKKDHRQQPSAVEDGHDPQQEILLILSMKIVVS